MNNMELQIDSGEGLNVEGNNRLCAAMKLYEFTPDEIGFNSFFVISESIEEAIESLKKLKEEYSSPEQFFDNKHKYKIKEFNANEPTWVMNC